MSTPVISVKDASIKLGDKLILKDLNLNIFKGESIAVIGPSGHGKTVFLKLLAGVYPPSKGHIYIHDKDWQSLENEQKHDLAKDVGMMFQQGALFDNLNALDNVEFPLKEHLQIPSQEAHETAKEILDRVNLSKAYYKKPAELSGGMQKRLAIARALVLNPQIVFYDDPTAGQDPVQGDQVTSLILEFKKKNNSTIIMATSHMASAYKVADRILMVIDQEVIDTGSPLETKSHSDPRVQQFINGEVEGPIKY